MWYRTRVKLNLSTYLSLFRRNNSFYRRLIHSNRKVGGVSNRRFFKENFVQISYRIDWTSENEIQVVFYFLSKKDINDRYLPTSLLARMKNIVFTSIDFEIVESGNTHPINYPQLFNNRKIKT